MFHVAFWFIKQLYYLLKRFTKYKLLLLVGVALLVYFLLSNHVFGYDSYTVTLDNQNYTVTDCNSVVHNAISVLPEYTSGDYIYFTRIASNTNRTVTFFKKSDLSNFRLYAYFYNLNGTRVLRVQFLNDNFITCKRYDINNDTGNTVGYNTTTANPSNWWDFNVVTNNTIEYYGNTDYYYTSIGDTLIFNTDILNPVVLPYIVNSSEIPSWSFTNNKLLINTVSLTTSNPLASWNYELRVVYDVTQDISFPINSYILIDETTEPSTLYFNIPINLINNYFTFRPGKTIHFWLNRSSIYADMHDTYDLGIYTLTLTQAEADIINTNTQQEQQANDSQNLQSISSSLSDSSVDFTLDDLPQDSSEDITREGINNIFSGIYNAFCNGQAVNISFPIPFINKTINLPSDYTRNMLVSNNGSAIITFIEACWWYIIGRFIILDILRKITKIKAGNVEHIEDTNIKGEML